MALNKDIMRRVMILVLTVSALSYSVYLLCRQNIQRNDFLYANFYQCFSNFVMCQVCSLC